jgi:hypothetical protein
MFFYLTLVHFFQTGAISDHYCSLYDCGDGAAFKVLGQLILEVGMLLAHHCDKYGMSIKPKFTLAVYGHV